ncbi:MAG: hypothetical protein WAK40_02250 [Thermoplasmata archaeon]
MKFRGPSFALIRWYIPPRIDLPLGPVEISQYCMPGIPESLNFQSNTRA